MTDTEHWYPINDTLDPSCARALEAYRDSAAHDIQDRVDDTMTRWKNEHE